MRHTSINFKLVVILKTDQCLHGFNIEHYSLAIVLQVIAHIAVKRRCEANTVGSNRLETGFS